MQDLVFNVLERNEKGRKVRNNGEVPGIIYGGSLENSIPCKISKKEMLKLLSSNKSQVISLNLDGTIEKCVLKEVQRNTFGEIIHIDFQHVEKGDSVKLKVPVGFEGQGYLESKGLLLEVFVSEVQLQGHPEDIPEKLKIDVSELNQGDSVLFKDLVTPENLKSDVNDDKIMATVCELSSNVEEEEIESVTE